MNMTGRIVGVTGQSVMRWVKEFSCACLREPKPGGEEEIEIDGMHHFSGEKNGFFGSGKYLVIPLGDSLAESAAIVVRLPLRNSVK